MPCPAIPGHGLPLHTHWLGRRGDRHAGAPAQSLPGPGHVQAVPSTGRAPNSRIHPASDIPGTKDGACSALTALFLLGPHFVPTTLT